MKITWCTGCQGSAHTGREWSAPTTTQPFLPPLKLKTAYFYHHSDSMQYYSIFTTAWPPLRSFWAEPWAVVIVLTIFLLLLGKLVDKSSQPLLGGEDESVVSSDGENPVIMEPSSECAPQYSPSVSHDEKEEEEEQWAGS